MASARARSGLSPSTARPLGPQSIAIAYDIAKHIRARPRLGGGFRRKEGGPLAKACDSETAGRRFARAWAVRTPVATVRIGMEVEQQTVGEKASLRFCSARVHK
jgi:hypothetical protein